jgi:hypothetical protein
MDVPAGARLSERRSTPSATVPALLATLLVVAAALVAHALGDAGSARRASAFLAFFTALFLVRVVGQVVVLVAGPPWLPPMEEWNLVSYPVLLPAQLVLLAAMTGITADLARGAELLPAAGAGVGRLIVAAAVAYWAAMAVR